MKVTWLDQPLVPSMNDTSSQVTPRRRRKRPFLNEFLRGPFLFKPIIVLFWTSCLWNPQADAFVPTLNVRYLQKWTIRSALKVVEHFEDDNSSNEKPISPRTSKVKQQRFAQSQYIKPKATMPRGGSRLVVPSIPPSSSSQQRGRDPSRTVRNSSVSRKPSIEELEQRLSQKYGTDMSRWTSGDYDDDDDGEEEEDASTVASIPARPVRDPWLQMDAATKSSTDATAVEAPIRRLSAPITPPTPKVILESSPSKSTASPLAAFGRRQVSEVQSINDMHRPPVMPDVPPSNRETIDSKTKDSTKEQSSARTAYRPVLDNNGRPVLLTLNQAQSLFQETLDLENISDLELEGTSIASFSSWEDLGITDPRLLSNLAGMGCATPLPAQQTAVPRICSGETDVVVGTYTGSGKTLAVMVPLIQRLLSSTPSEKDSKNSVRLMVCAPGRELASQIASVTRELVQDLNLSVMLAIGGTTFSRNVEQIRRRKPEILVGTPGRLAELVVGTSGALKGRLSVQQVQAVVLDEFDALLSYAPHADPVRALVGALKRARGASLQSILCSATAVDMLNQKSWEENFLRSGYVWAMADPEDQLVTSSGEAFANTIRVSRTVMHGVVHVPQKRFALETLRRILHTEPFPQQILIFVADARKVDICVEKLAQVGILAAPLHGDSDKMDRAEISQALREGTVGMVVATEMAARGLDAPLLTHVINMDLPTDAAHYAHRAGRCGRGGRPGVVINLTTSPQERGVPMKFAKQLGIPMYTVEVKNSKLNVVEDVVLPAPEGKSEIA
jgi:superfamily II DNA/RNA helicase